MIFFNSNYLLKRILKFNLRIFLNKIKTRFDEYFSQNNKEERK